MIHLANIDFEHELATHSNFSIFQALNRSPLSLQLQFLPLLYGESNEFVAVSAFPSSSYWKSVRKVDWLRDSLPTCCLVEQKLPSEVKNCYSWGPSKAIQKWASQQAIDYSIPENIDLIRQINSKAFSFNYSKLENAALIYNEKELFEWTLKVEGGKVLKSCFGLSGSGNRRFKSLEDLPSLLSFCHKEWNLERPLIAEPWVKRVLDFSTQWLIKDAKTIQFIGATRFETDSNGVYKGTLAGPEPILFTSLTPYVDEHKKEALLLLKTIQEKGYFGHVGIDAFLYQKEGSDALFLNPILEINGRQTMSLVALRMQQKICPDQSLQLFFDKEEAPSLLPNELILSNGKKVIFKHRLYYKLGMT